MNTYLLSVTLHCLVIVMLYFLSKKFLTARRVFTVFTIATMTLYLLWRTFFTLDLGAATSLILGILLLSSEWLGFLRSIIFNLLFWKEYKPELAIPVQKTYAKSVDIFIATYNEPLSILKRTISGCKNIDYPQELLKIHICDDGRRKHVSKLAKLMGIEYISRDNNTHYKAGNINNALAQTQGDLLLMLDADMVPTKNILKEMAHYFNEDTVGFVQSPQTFFNPDPYQYNLGIENLVPNEQDLFMRNIEVGRANYNAVLHVGTNAMFRRSSLNEIGGIPTGSITEDMATGMLLQAKGYKSVFVNKQLATGLSSENFSDFIAQRQRWCRGNIQVAKKWNPFKLKGLGIIQKIIYMDGVIHWFSGLQKSLYLLAPVLFVFTNAVFMNTDFDSMLTFMLPALLATNLMYKAIDKKGSILVSHILEISLLPYITKAAVMELLFSKQTKFNVTPKGKSSDKGIFLWKAAWPFILFAIISIFALGITVYQMGFYISELLVVSQLWLIYNLIGVAGAIKMCYEKPRYRLSERFLINNNAWLDIKIIGQATKAKILDISEKGLGLEISDPTLAAAITKNTRIKFVFRGHKYAAKVERIDSSTPLQFGVSMNYSDGNYINMIHYIYDLLIKTNEKRTKLRRDLLLGFKRVTVGALSFAIFLVPTMGANYASTLVTSEFDSKYLSDEGLTKFDYKTALQYSSEFFDANKCGSDAGEDNVFEWRDACHTDDGADIGIDLSGGYHDAGDHVKFGLNQAYTASVLGWSYFENKEVFKKTENDKKTLATLKHFTDYFLKSHPESDIFYYQVGDGKVDHKNWNSPEQDEKGRSTLYFADSKHPASDVCGMTAAALAIMYLNYDEIDPSYALKCLYAAKEIYTLGVTNKGFGKGQDFYVSTSYNDDLTWGATWLYLATKQQSYLKDALSFIKYDTSGGKNPYISYWTMCWDDIYLAAFTKLFEITTDKAFSKAIDHSLHYWQKRLYRTPAGLRIIQPWGSVRFAMGESMIALMRYKQNKDATHWNFAKSQIDYVLGNNPSNTSLMIGFGDNWLQNPHHKAANGKNITDRETGAKNLLKGAISGGPDKKDKIIDQLSAVEYTETSIDYNATFIAAVTTLMSTAKDTNYLANNTK